MFSIIAKIAQIALVIMAVGALPFSVWIYISNRRNWPAAPSVLLLLNAACMFILLVSAEITTYLTRNLIGRAQIPIIRAQAFVFVVPGGISAILNFVFVLQHYSRTRKKRGADDGLVVDTTGNGDVLLADQDTWPPAPKT